MLQTISAKREAFRAEIRAKQINQIMNKIRIQIRKEERASLIETIIQSTHSQVSAQQLRMLMKMGQRGQQNAVIHIGNLIIDNILDIQTIKQFEHQHPSQPMLGNCQHYIWLLHVLYQHGYFKQQYLLHLAHYIINEVQLAHKNMEMSKLEGSTIFLQHGLTLFRKLIKKHASAAQLIIMEDNNNLNTKLVRTISLICKAGLKTQINTVCYSILNCLTFTNQSSNNTIIQLMGAHNFQTVIRNGIMRIESTIRCLTYQILNNSIILQYSHIQPFLCDIMPGILGSWAKQKVSVQIQISYLILTIIDKLNIDTIVHIIHQLYLVSQIKNIIQVTDVQELTKNCLTALSILDKMFIHSSDCRIRAQFVFTQNLKQKIINFDSNQ